MYDSFLIHSCTDRHLGCFQHLAIAKCTTMNIGVHRFNWITAFGFLGYNPSNGIARSIGSPILVFWGNSILFSTVAVQVCIPTNSVLGFPFLHNLASTCLLISFFTFFYCCSNTVIYFSPNHSPRRSHPHTPPLGLIPLWFVHVTSVHVNEILSPLLPHCPLRPLL